jgi:hypothetical protein
MASSQVNGLKTATPKAAKCLEFNEYKLIEAARDCSNETVHLPNLAGDAPQAHFSRRMEVKPESPCERTASRRLDGQFTSRASARVAILQEPPRPDPSLCR